MRTIKVNIEGVDVYVSFSAHAVKRQDRKILEQYYVSKKDIINTLSKETSDGEDIVLFRMMEVPKTKVFNPVTGREELPRVIVIDKSQRISFVASICTDGYDVYLDIITIWPDVNILHGAKQHVVYAA